MVSSFMIIVRQVIVLAILLLIGFIGTKLGMIDDRVSRGLTDLAINFSIPCMLIRAFQSDYNSRLLKLFFLEVLISLILHVSAGLISAVLVPGKDGRTRALRLCIIFGNVGFVGFPLVRSILDDLGVFYASGFNFILALGIWTFGTWYINRGSSELDVRTVIRDRVIKNPSFIALFVGLAIFLLQIKLPPILDVATEYLAALALPLPMFIIGHLLSNTDLKAMLSDGRNWWSAFIRLLLIPVAAIFALHFAGADPMLVKVSAVALGTPPATVLAMVAEDRDVVSYASGVIASQTVISMFTLPLVTALAFWMAG